MRLHHADSGRSDHWENAPHCIKRLIIYSGSEDSFLRRSKDDSEEVGDESRLSNGMFSILSLAQSCKIKEKLWFTICKIFAKLWFYFELWKSLKNLNFALNQFQRISFQKTIFLILIKMTLIFNNQIVLCCVVKLWFFRITTSQFDKSKI